MLNLIKYIKEYFNKKSELKRFVDHLKYGDIVWVDIKKMGEIKLEKDHQKRPVFIHSKNKKILTVLFMTSKPCKEYQKIYTNKESYVNCRHTYNISYKKIYSLNKTHLPSDELLKVTDSLLSNKDETAKKYAKIYSADLVLYRNKKYVALEAIDNYFSIFPVCDSETNVDGWLTMPVWTNKYMKKRYIQVHKMALTWNGRVAEVSRKAIIKFLQKNKKEIDLNYQAGDIIEYNNVKYLVKSRNYDTLYIFELSNRKIDKVRIDNQLFVSLNGIYINIADVTQYIEHNDQYLKSLIYEMKICKKQASLDNDIQNNEIQALEFGDIISYNFQTGIIFKTEGNEIFAFKLTTKKLINNQSFVDDYYISNEIIKASNNKIILIKKASNNLVDSLDDYINSNLVFTN